MPRKARKDLETSFFHIMVQGINREYIFERNECKEKYKSLLIKYMDEYEVKLLAYCVMDNHSHMLLFSERIENMSKFMKSVNTSYGQYYNKLFKRVGFVFRDRYLSEPIYTEKHLLGCIPYIHMNPVKAKLVTKQEKYKYSSYNEYLRKNGIITSEILKIIFGSEKDYLQSFLELEEEEFLDFEKRKDNTKEEIDKYCKTKNMGKEQIIENKLEFAELVRYLVQVKKIKIVNIAKVLGVNRLKISRLLNEQK